MSGSVTATVDIQGGLSQAWSSIATFVPKFLVFLVILLVGWLIAKAIAKGLDVLLRKIGLERAAERSRLNRLFGDSDWDTTKLISRVVYYGLLLIVLQAAFGVFGPNPISNVLSSIVTWLPRAIIGIVIVVVAAAIAHAARDLLSHMLSGVAVGQILANVAWVFILGLGVIAALNQMGIAAFVSSAVLTAVLATVAGVLIIGVGGGLVRPMQERWGRWLERIEEESARTGSVPRAREGDDQTAAQAQARQAQGTSGRSTPRPGPA